MMIRIRIDHEQNIEELWLKILENLETTRPELYRDFNQGCTIQEIRELENLYNIKFPPALQTIYLITNGQKGEHTGLFLFEKKVFSMLIGLVGGCRLLSLKEIEIEWDKLRKDKDLDVYKPLDMPFAKDKGYDYICIDITTGNIIGLWIGGPDWTIPREWQTDRMELTKNLGELLKLYLKFLN